MTASMAWEGQSRTPASRAAWIRLPMPSATWSLSVSDNSPKPPDQNLFNQAASVLRAPAYCSGLRQPSLGAEGVGLPKDMNGLPPPPSDMGAMGVSA
jgi:hypothetical protein